MPTQFLSAPRRDWPRHCVFLVESRPECANGVAPHLAQNATHSGAPWAVWRNRFCLAGCLARRHVQGRKQGTTARHGTVVIVGHRLLFSNVRQNPVVFYPWDAPVCRRHLRSAFGAKRALSAKQTRLNWSKNATPLSCNKSARVVHILSCRSRSESIKCVGAAI
jgi:hypothetical protein